MEIVIPEDNLDGTTVDGADDGDAAMRHKARHDEGSWVEHGEQLVYEDVGLAHQPRGYIPRAKGERLTTQFVCFFLLFFLLPPPLFYLLFFSIIVTNVVQQT